MSFCIVLGWVENPSTGPEAIPVRDKPDKLINTPASFCSLHVFYDLQIRKTDTHTGLSLEAGYCRSSGGCESSSHWLLGHVEFAFWSRVTSRGSRVNGRESRVTSRGSRVNGRGSKNPPQLFLNVVKSKFRVYSSFRCLFYFYVNT